MRNVVRAVVLSTVLVPCAVGAQARRTENVVVIVTDGVRWQEMFRGAERGLISRSDGGVSDTAALRREFWRESAEERRRILFPFIWGTVAKEGQLLGDQDHGSVAHTTNPLKFSYPGYNEILTGWYDERIDSNEYPPNPNVTVFEWLNARKELRGKVGAVATWDAFRRIFNEERAGFPVIDGWTPLPFQADEARDARRATINELYRTSVQLWPTNTFDAPMQLVAKEFIREHRPRLLFIGYGETDEWAHARRYDVALHAARQVDAFIADLWTTMQGMKQYRGRTTFIITTDHGRGDGREWTSHGKDVAGAENIWMAILGPDVAPLGARANVGAVTQSQIAATVADLLGLGAEYAKAAPKAGKALELGKE